MNDATPTAPMFNDLIDQFIRDNVNSGWRYLKNKTGLPIKDLQRRAGELGVVKDTLTRGMTPLELAEGIGYPESFILGEIRAKRLKVKEPRTKGEALVNPINVCAVREWIARYFPIDLSRVEKAGGREWFCDLMLGGEFGSGVAGDPTDLQGREEDGWC